MLQITFHLPQPKCGEIQRSYRNDAAIYWVLKTQKTSLSNSGGTRFLCHMYCVSFVARGPNLPTQD